MAGISRRGQYYTTYTEAHQIITVCSRLSRSGSVNRMWEAFFSALWMSGLRVSEILALHLGDISVDTCTIDITRLKKPNPSVERHPIPLLLASTLDTYRLITHGLHWDRDRSRLMFPVTRQAVNKMLRKACPLAGVRPLSPHLFRHGYAHHFLKSHRGKDRIFALHELQALMGHASVDTTAQYLTPSRRDLADAIQATTF